MAESFMVIDHWLKTDRGVAHAYAWCRRPFSFQDSRAFAKAFGVTRSFADRYLKALWFNPNRPPVTSFRRNA